jgi:hypothetical protein
MPVHERSNVTIREDIKGRILLTGLQSVPINSIDDLLTAHHPPNRLYRHQRQVIKIPCNLQLESRSAQVLRLTHVNQGEAQISTC